MLSFIKFIIESLDHWINSDKEKEAEVEKRLHKDPMDAPASDHDHIQKYTDDSSFTNKKLLGHDVSDYATYHGYRHDNHVKHLDNILAKHKLEHETSVYSGMGEQRAKVAMRAASEGKHLHLPAYTSASIDRSIAHKFSRLKGNAGFHKESHILHIHLPKGHTGAYIGGSSSLKHEKEFLLPRNTHLHIEKEPETHDYVKGGVKHQLHVWHAHPVEHHD